MKIFLERIGALAMLKVISWLTGHLAVAKFILWQTDQVVCRGNKALEHEIRHEDIVMELRWVRSMDCALCSEHVYEGEDWKRWNKRLLHETCYHAYAFRQHPLANMIAVLEGMAFEICRSIRRFKIENQIAFRRPSQPIPEAVLKTPNFEDGIWIIHYDAESNCKRNTNCITELKLAA